MSAITIQLRPTYVTHVLTLLSQFTACPISRPVMSRATVAYLPAGGAYKMAQQSVAPSPCPKGRLLTFSAAAFRVLTGAA